MSEGDYLAGQRSAWLRVLSEALRNLDAGDETARARRIAEAEQARAVLRSALADHDDDPGPDAHLADMARQLAKWAGE